MNILKYNGRVVISKIQTVAQPVGIAEVSDDVVIPNNGTYCLWRLLCLLLRDGKVRVNPNDLSTNLTEEGVDLPYYIDIGYFKKPGQAGQELDGAAVQDYCDKGIYPLGFLPEGQSAEFEYQSLIAGAGNRILERSLTLTTNRLGTTPANLPILELTAYFSAASFSQRASENQGAEIFIVLKSGAADGRILALADTGLKEYSILDNETHIIKWQLNFVNVSDIPKED